MAQDITSFLVNAKIHEFIDAVVLDMINDGEIANIDNTYLQQIAIFHDNDPGTCGIGDNLNCAENLTVDLMNAILPIQYGYNYTIENNGLRTVIASRNLDSFETSDFALASRKLTFFKLSESEIFGPAITEVLIWS